MNKVSKIFCVVLAFAMLGLAMNIFYTDSKDNKSREAFQKQLKYCSKEYPATKDIKSFDQISIEHSGCIYLCQQYKIFISGVGLVNYMGSTNGFVKTQGAASATLSQQQMAALINAINVSGFFSIPKYTFGSEEPCGAGGGYDGASTRISVTVDGKKHEISYSNTPTQLVKFGNDVEQIVNSRQWTGTLEEMSR